MICRGCGIDKPQNCFAWRSDVKLFRTTCRECRRKSNGSKSTIPVTKSCSGCSETKAASEFYVNQGRLRSTCKACDLAKKANADSGERARKSSYNKLYIAKNREKLSALAKERRAKNAAQISVSRRRYRLANPLKISRRKRAHYEANADRLRREKLAYQKAHPEATITAQQKRRARKLGLPDTLTTAEWRRILEYHDHRCAYCLEPYTKLEQEHVIAIVRGGGTVSENIVPACRSCNARKGDRPVFWMATFI